MEWNDLGSGDRPPSWVRPYPLYNEIGQVHGGLGELVYGLHVPESRKVLQQRVVNHGGVVEPEKPWTMFGCSVLTLCVSGCVGLDQPLLGGPSGVFLVVKEDGSRA
jgi:hypothetical protein